MATLHASSPSSPHSTYSSLSEEISLQQAASALLAWLDAHEPGEQMPQTSVKKVQALFSPTRAGFTRYQPKRTAGAKTTRRSPKTTSVKAIFRCSNRNCSRLRDSDRPNS